jgi:uncharacterized protein (DUF2267 family)
MGLPGVPPWFQFVSARSSVNPAPGKKIAHFFGSICKGGKMARTQQRKQAKSAVKNQKAAAPKRMRASGRGSFTGTRVFDRSLQKTNLMLKELMIAMNWDSRERALAAFRATLHALRDVLPLGEIIHLGAQLPIIVRGIYYEGWHYNPQPLRLKSVAEFYELVREYMGNAHGFTTQELKNISRVVLLIINDHVSAGEMGEIRGVLKRQLKALIPDIPALAEFTGRFEGADGHARSRARKARRGLASAKVARQDRIERSDFARHARLRAQ